MQKKVIYRIEGFSLFLYIHLFIIFLFLTKKQMEIETLIEKIPRIFLCDGNKLFNQTTY